MIQEAYVSFETAELLKKKGFDVACISLYLVDGTYSLIINEPKNYNEEHISRPTHQMALAWLREKDIYVDIVPHYINKRKKRFLYVIKDEHAFWQSEEFFKTYEEATEAAIKYSLENLI